MNIITIISSRCRYVWFVQVVNEEMKQLKTSFFSRVRELNDRRHCHYSRNYKQVGWYTRKDVDRQRVHTLLNVDIAISHETINKPVVSYQTVELHVYRQCHNVYVQSQEYQ